ncbi:rhodanese-related sulfurtransferase [Algoriphagus boseongensis]|uniref:Rhodanese-related sulfurtransferase n=1 Tax=Algoriphagus boseongensis TaxID=1442587 RepID=A0A4R6T1T7_9BACT|nr:rhodanese-like domain-containing protein [Algoriphagus boseongensis]TDQ13590.1 rhodanese-related sulfurtransferase [Algoriphagus boseongensis]
MKIRILFLLAFLVTSSLAFSQTVEKDSIQVISIAQFEKMSTKKKSMVVDVRTPEEAAEGHLAGSVNINFLGENFGTEIQSLDKKKTYLLYCKSGNRTRKAAGQMLKAGFKHVYMLEGGITNWQNSGKPVEK